MAVKERILVVDDEPSIRKYLQTLLEVDGFEVEAVGSGKEAINRVNKGERPDFIILDVLMPQMGGLETLQELMQMDKKVLGGAVRLVLLEKLGRAIITTDYPQSALDATLAECRKFPGPMWEIGNNFVRHALRSKHSPEPSRPVSSL
jgi:CheY-like chemotaxis protein